MPAPAAPWLHAAFSRAFCKTKKNKNNKVFHIFCAVPGRHIRELFQGWNEDTTARKNLQTGNRANGVWGEERRGEEPGAAAEATRQGAVFQALIWSLFPFLRQGRSLPQLCKVHKRAVSITAENHVCEPGIPNPSIPLARCKPAAERGAAEGEGRAEPASKAAGTLRSCPPAPRQLGSAPVPAL